jgi:signal transduction histidine kinase
MVLRRVRLTPAGWLRAPRPTARLRLTLLYGLLFLMSGTALLAISYLLVEHATASVTLPGGAKVTFSNPTVINGPAIPAHWVGGRPVAAGEQKPHFTSSQLAALKSQAEKLHAFDMHELVMKSGIALGVTAIIAVLLGWLVAGRVLRPVRTISATARKIGASNLQERLSLDAPDDEFRELAVTLNDLLARLQASFDSQRRFVANASHELRTPLTLDRALLERALRNTAPTQTLWRSTCERLLASSQQQDRMIDALLTLARSEGGVRRFETFELSSAIDGVLLNPDLDVNGYGLRVETDIGPATVSGDPRLIERLVRNLVDNAVRYNRPYGTVSISVGTCTGGAVLAVANTGPAIASVDIERIFQPFERLDLNRHGRGDGIGLGLSIVKAIADAHDARISVRPQLAGGLRVEVAFPTADALLERPGAWTAPSKGTPSRGDQPPIDDRIVVALSSRRGGDEEDSSRAPTGRAVVGSASNPTPQLTGRLGGGRFPR